MKWAYLQHTTARPGQRPGHRFSREKPGFKTREIFPGPGSPWAETGSPFLPGKIRIRDTRHFLGPSSPWAETGSPFLPGKHRIHDTRHLLGTQIPGPARESADLGVHWALPTWVLPVQSRARVMPGRSGACAHPGFKAAPHLPG